MSLSPDVSPPVAVDREIVEHSFREWQQEQSLLDAQLAESVAALDAYQLHLDNWQQELARERDELHELREALERDRAAGGAGNEHFEQLQRELNDSRDKVASLTTALLARTEELRELDRQRESVGTELAHARDREKELTDRLTAKGEPNRNSQPDAFDTAIEQAAASNQGDAARSGAAKVEPRRSASPVLGSVMEQFGKLREQRSMNRSNNKPR
jgi:septal ring factor EnvC (AmiA/AmiB activator)